MSIKVSWMLFLGVKAVIAGLGWSTTPWMEDVGWHRNAATSNVFALAVGPHFMCAQLHKKAAAHEIPKVRYRLRLEAWVGRLHAPRPQGALHAVFVRAMHERETGRRLEPKLCKAPSGLPWLMMMRPLCVCPAAQQVAAGKAFEVCCPFALNSYLQTHNRLCRLQAMVHRSRRQSKLDLVRTPASLNPNTSFRAWLDPPCPPCCRLTPASTTQGSGGYALTACQEGH